MFKKAALVVALTAPLCSTAFAADPILRDVDPTHHMPIAKAVEVPAGYSTVYVSGMGAEIANKSAPERTLAAYGDTETQTRSALMQLRKELNALHLTEADVVQMHVYIAADPALGKIDFPGMMKAYKEFYGTAAQPNLPARAAFQVANLANPGWLVEIEVIAARPPHS